MPNVELKNKKGIPIEYSNVDNVVVPDPNGDPVSYSRLPEVDDSDNGKVLGVVNGEWGIAEDAGAILPEVTSSDNGKVLGVVNGEWNISDGVRASVTKSGNTATITVTDANGTQSSASISDGTNGTNGTDGYSPEVTITPISGGTTVTITDADHPSGQSFNVMNGTNGIIEATYSELVTLATNSSLIPGQQYRMTDYETIITGAYNLSAIGAQGYLHYGVSAGHPFDLILTADDESHFNENVRAIQHSGDTYFADSDLAAWRIKYTIENDQQKYTWANPEGKGVIWWMEDEFNNKAPYDFKNIQFVRYALKQADPQGDYTPSATALVYDSSTQPNRYGSYYHVFMALQAYMDAGSYVNPFMHSYEGSQVADYDFSVSYNILGCIQMASIDATFKSTFNADTYYTFDYLDENGNHIDASLNTLSCVPCRENYIEIETDGVASLLLYQYNIYGLNHTVWETSKIYMYTLETAWNSISNNYISSHCYANTFGNRCYSNKLSIQCFANTFGDSCNSNTFGDSCNSNTFGNFCDSNTFGYNCNSNTFGYNCYSNTFGDSCNSNTFGDSCNSNTFGNFCDSNTFGYNCNSNTFGDSCNSNTFGNFCDSNTFGYNCNSNTFGYNCNSNTFGDSCDSNTFGYNCYSNTFGDSCNFNTFGTYDQNNELKGYMQYIHAGDKCQYVTVNSLGTYVYLYSLEIGSWVSGLSVPANQLSDTGTYKLMYYGNPGSSTTSGGSATLIHVTGYNTETVVETTDGGQTWTSV